MKRGYRNGVAPKNGGLLTDLRLLLKANVLIANVVPVFTGFWLALHFMDLHITDYWDVLILTLAGSTFVMAGALVINNWYDVDIDTIMDRTKRRPTVTGRISLNRVLIMGIFCTVSGFILLLFTTVEASIYALIGWFSYVFLYTMWSKRKYTINTVIGSISGAVSPFMGWTAIQPGFHKVPIVLFLILFIWQMPHTYAIAIRKYHDYKAAGVAMLPVVRGIAVTKRHVLVYAVCLFPLPFYLASIGKTFMIVAVLLNVIWIGIALSGFITKDDQRWARIMFLYSVNYIMILFVLMVIVTLPL
ncbi:Protoheme IX farnesyltransferase 2 [Paenibacillus solanacearum]|uniref:Protoheme IX farnesyltransferase n=1 Tax=Paenibacillus solanacearum TaxID=2048548 RepID=A0A916NL16_9BACL|nr:heme o synthase [Paenibacillus solanacearum]CAG7648056.1 Protoheme IX farnesyltransferase 2 [Paenibacillus solanacearum]